MVCETFTGDTFIHRTDPVFRLIAAVLISLMLAVVSRPQASAAGLVFGLILCVATRLPAVPLIKRLTALNVFIAMLIVTFALTMGGQTVSFGPLPVSLDGLARAASIALRANAIVLIITPLISTMEVPVLGHALQRLGAPRTLILLLVFTVRYIDVLHHQYARLRRGMRSRCFRPAFNMHTCRTFGRLVGMLLISSLNRSERVLAAMKCRGFDGTFPDVRPHHRLSAGRDAVFCVGCLLIFSLIAGFEWIW